MSLSQGKAQGEFSPRAWERTWERTWEQTWEQQGHKSNKATKATRPQKQQGHKNVTFQGFHVIFKGPGLGFSRISRRFQGPWPWIFKDSTSFSKAPALDFLPILPILSILRIVSILPILPILRICQHLSISRVKVLPEISGSISRNFQGPQPSIFKDSTSFSKAPALDFQGFHCIFKGPGIGFSRIIGIWAYRHMGISLYGHIGIWAYGRMGVWAEMSLSQGKAQR